MISKRRKIIDGVEITLMQKSVTEPIIDTEFLYVNLESRLIDHLNSKLHTLPVKISEITTKEIQTVLLEQSTSILSGLTFNQSDFFSTISNDPFDGSILTYDNQNDSMIWKQSPNSKFDELDNIIFNYNSIFESDYIITNKLHIPFAVAWGDNNWGGNGKSGIFFNNPWDTPVDNFSIKMGRDNATLGETGYTYGSVGGLSMKFSNGYETDVSNGEGSPGGWRGFVWDSVGAGSDGPVMSLDSHNGILAVKDSIISNNNISSNNGNIVATTGNLVSGSHVNENVGEISGHIQILQWYPSTGNSLIYLMSYGEDTSNYDGYVATYQADNANSGRMKLMPPTGGSGGGTLPGVEIDMGSFLNNESAEVDCGSFI